MAEEQSDMELGPEVEWSGSRDWALKVIGRQRKQLQKRWQRADAGQGSLADIGAAHRMIASWQWALGFRSEAVEEFRISAWYDLWWYRLRLLPDGESIELPLVGSGRNATFMAHRDNPLRGLWYANLIGMLLVDDQRGLQLVLDWEDFSGTDNTSFKNAVVSMWRALAQGDHLQAAQWLAQVEQVMSEPRAVQLEEGAFDRKRQPFVENRIVRSVLEGSQPNFSEAIALAHRYHIEYELRADLVSMTHDRAHRMINWRLSALIKLGVANGLTYKPQSPYFVDWTPWLQDQDSIAESFEPNIE